MIEVRPIFIKEIDEFLKLLTIAFNLDPNLAQKLFFKDPFFDINRKWALFINGKIQSILTTVPLTFGIGNAIGISGVATQKTLQSKGLATILIKSVIDYHLKNDVKRALLFAQNPRLYENAGFNILDQIIRGTIKTEIKNETQFCKTLTLKQISHYYHVWSSQDPLRLIRDDQRWRYWKFMQKKCFEYQQGYLCYENGSIREIIADICTLELSIPKSIEWFGLKSLTQELKIPLQNFKTELLFMGMGFSKCPKMFMSDQF